MSRRNGKTRSVSKFEDRVAELVYQLSLDGGADEEVGSSVEAPGTWAGLMRGGAQMAQAIEADAKEYDLDAGDKTDLTEIRRSAGVILFEESNGSVGAEVYEDGDALEERWEVVSEELGGDDEDDDGDTDVPSDEYLENRKWTRAYINSLPDSHFLYVDRRAATSRDEHGRSHPFTARHFPYRDKHGRVDLLHVRDALSRIPQSNVSKTAQNEARRKAERILSQHGGYRGRGPTSRMAANHVWREDFTEMGRRAFKKGLPRRVVMDEAFIDAVGGDPSGNLRDPRARKGAEEWYRGWDQANIDEPVHGANARHDPTWGPQARMRFDNKYTIGEPGAVYEFNVKMRHLRGVNISNDQLMEETYDALRSFERDVLSKYGWVGDVSLTGRSGGWLAIEDISGKATKVKLDKIAQEVERDLRAFQKRLREQYGEQE